MNKRINKHVYYETQKKQKSVTENDQENTII
jgi:hypothetical protein